jgi:hypothetical protein
LRSNCQILVNAIPHCFFDARSAQDKTATGSLRKACDTTQKLTYSRPLLRVNAFALVRCLKKTLAFLMSNLWKGVQVLRHSRTQKRSCLRFKALTGAAFWRTLETKPAELECSHMCYPP